MANIINGTDTGSGGLITTGDSSDELQLQTAETARVTLTNTAVVVNEGGNNVDFRVEGDTEANLLFVDAGNDRVGIGTATPGQLLDVAGTVEVDRLNVYGASFSEIYFDGGQGAISYDNANDAQRFYTNSSERMRITSAGAVQIANGNLVFSTNGTGIDFSASAGGGASSSLLDDYEEGTWTPTLTSGYSVAPTVGLAGGSYIKIGRLVTFSFTFNVSGGTKSASQFVLSGLPFTSATSANAFGFAWFNYNSGFKADNELSLHITSNSTTIATYLTNGAIMPGTSITASTWGIQVNGFYYSAA